MGLFAAGATMKQEVRAAKSKPASLFNRDIPITLTGAEWTTLLAVLIHRSVVEADVTFSILSDMGRKKRRSALDKIKAALDKAMKEPT